MKKEGQPESATAMTLGRSSLVRSLYSGVANKEDMAMAANWMRDVWREQPGLRPVVDLWFYQALMSGEAEDITTQHAVLGWLSGMCGFTVLSNQGIQILPGIANINEIRKAVGEEPIVDMTLTANQRQVGGSHYKSFAQHWDYIVGNDHSYLGGQVSKYLTRWRDKNGLEDIQKSRHYLDKMMEVHDNKPRKITPEHFAKENKLGTLEKSIVMLIDMYENTRDRKFLEMARAFMDDLQSAAVAAAPKKP